MALADIEFVLEDEGQELGVREPAGGRFLQADVKGGRQAGEPELFQCECGIVGGS